jgi:DNA-binding MarR family transcriptional regulator
MRLVAHGVSFGHWTFLRILWEREGLTQRELSEQAGVMEPTTFSALKAMEGIGYVKRRRLPENRKNIHVFLTAKGRALKEKLVPLAEDVNRVAVTGLAEEDISKARQILIAIIANLAQDEAHGTDGARRVPSTRELARLVAAGTKARRSRA